MRTKAPASAAAIVFLAAAAIAAIYVNIAKNPETSFATADREEFFNYTLHFCGSEDCMAALGSQLAGAKDSARCALYRLDSSVLESISESVAASEIALDEKAKITAVAAIAANVRIFRPKPKGIMHNKYCIIDGRTVITGSFNPTAAAATDYNDLLVINSTSLASFYNSNFEKLKRSGKSKTPTSAAVASSKPRRKAAILNDTAAEAYFCPEDSCADAVKRKLRAANKSIIFAAYSFTHPGIANELILKRSEGIAVAGIMEKSTAGSRHSKHSAMAANGIDVRLESSKRLMHHKLFVIDNETVITGSFNPTQSADERNAENLLIIRNSGLAHEYAEHLNSLLSEQLPGP